MKSLGDQIREARKSLHLTQWKLAEVLKVERTTVSNWECGRAEPDLRTLRNLSEALQCDLLSECTDNNVDQEEIGRKITLNPCKSPMIEVISHENACNFSEITVDCSVNCVDQHGNAVKFRFFAPFSIETAEK